MQTKADRKARVHRTFAPRAKVTAALGGASYQYMALMLSRIPRGRYVAVLGVTVAAVIARSWYGAHYPHDWLIENSIVPLLLLVLAVTYRRFPLSRLSYTMIFAFLCLHEVGAHWTYAKVPYDEWTRTIFGFSLNGALGITRNCFDRLVHFSYGMLFAYPTREFFLRVANVKGFWGYFLPLDFMVSTSTIFEIVEWVATVSVGADLGQAYLGAQGDVWDAQKDIVSASCGALIAMCVIAAINARCKRDFARDFLQSLEVKRKQPLGEDGLARNQPEL